MIDDGDSGSPGRRNRPTTVPCRLALGWGRVEIAIAELPGVLILVPTLADAPLAMHKRIARELGLDDADFDIDLRPAD